MTAKVCVTRKRTPVIRDTVVSFRKTCRSIVRKDKTPLCLTNPKVHRPLLGGEYKIVFRGYFFCCLCKSTTAARVKAQVMDALHTAALRSPSLISPLRHVIRFAWTVSSFAQHPSLAANVTVHTNRASYRHPVAEAYGVSALEIEPISAKRVATANLAVPWRSRCHFSARERKKASRSECDSVEFSLRPAVGCFNLSTRNLGVSSHTPWYQIFQ